jgi:hypothetical protein
MDRQGLISLHQANGGHEANAANEGTSTHLQPSPYGLRPCPQTP